MNNSFFSDAGGIAACSRWLRSGSDDTTGRRRAQDFAPRPVSQQLFILACKSGGVAPLNHRLLASEAPFIL